MIILYHAPISKTAFPIPIRMKWYFYHLRRLHTIMTMTLIEHLGSILTTAYPASPNACLQLRNENNLPLYPSRVNHIVPRYLQNLVLWHSLLQVQPAEQRCLLLPQRLLQFERHSNGAKHTSLVTSVSHYHKAFRWVE